MPGASLHNVTKDVWNRRFRVWGLGFRVAPGPLASCCPKTKARAFVEESGAGLGMPFFGRLVGLKDPDFLRRV